MGYGGYDANNDGRVSFADSWADMQNGGGAGQAGDRFGGAFGWASNAMGMTPATYENGIRTGGFGFGGGGGGNTDGQGLSNGEGSEGRNFLYGYNQATGSNTGTPVAPPPFEYTPAPGVSQYYTPTANQPGYSPVSYSPPAYTPYASQASRLSAMIQGFNPMSYSPMQTSYSFGGPPSLGFGGSSYGFNAPPYSSYGGYGNYGGYNPSPFGTPISRPMYGVSGKGM